MDELVCFCSGVSKKEIENAISNGAKTLYDIQLATGASTGNQCKKINPKGRCCATEIIQMLKSNNDQQSKHCSCCS